MLDDSGILSKASDMDSMSDRESDNDSTTDIANKGLANVFAKILHKKTPKKVILAKSKTDKEIAHSRKKHEAQIVSDESENEDGETISFLTSKKKRKIEEDESSDDSVEEDWQEKKEKRIKKRMWEEMGHVKPDVLDKEKERNLQRIATKGVVQLFNAVKKQQKIVSEKLAEVGPSERKKDQVMKSLTKGQFMDVLRGAAVSDKDRKLSKQERATDSSENNPSWSILRDNYMMDAKMKDWDKDSDKENSENESETIESESDMD